MKKILEEIGAYIDAHRQEMVDKLTTFVNLEGHFTERDNVMKARIWFQKELEAEGFVCRFREVTPDRCGIMIADLGTERPGKPILFSGHCDTVHMTGSFGGPNPVRVEDGKIYGPGVLDMKGGHTSGIADHCESVFDIRVTNEKEAERTLKAMYEIAAKTFIEGTTTKMDHYRAKLLPLQETEESVKLFNLLNRVAEEEGFETFEKLHLGGASDAGNIAAAGLPVVDNCGIRGEYAHNLKEYGVIESLYDRAKIFAGAVAEIEEM